MTIESVFADRDTDILENLSRKDAVIFIGNAEGTHYEQENVGFSLIQQIQESHWSALFSAGKGKKIGDVVSYYDEAEYVWFHLIIGYSLDTGWEPDCYGKITEAYNKIWEEHESDYVRPWRTTYVARGKMRKHGDTEGQIVYGTMAMADSEARLAVYTRVPQ